MMSSNAAAAAEVFVYTGDGGERVPEDAVRVRVDPSVTSIPAYAFYNAKKLTEVELCEGLVEIGIESFRWCDHSITKIDIPTSLRRICNAAFRDSLRCPIRLHDGIESIGERAFAACIFTNFRVPSLITLIPHNMLNGCTSIFSVEMPKNITEIKNYAFTHCFCLRNVAFPPNAVIGNNTFPPDAVFGYKLFIEEGMTMITDLQLLFGSEAEIIRMLKHRFDGLPIHCIIYYQLYNQGVLQRLIAAVNMRSGQGRTLRSMLDPTGNQQDCLGMTPLHILASSSIHDLELYRVIVEKYPTNLITEDRWGALPLLYAFWGAAPTEIIHFLLDSYLALYPGHIFNWTMMVETMGRCDTPKESIENLLRVKQMHFPSQPINWEYLLDKFAEPSNCTFPGVPFHDRMRFLYMCGMSDRVEALAFKIWHDHITNMIQTADFNYGADNRSILHSIRAKLDHFEDELTKLKEVTTILELALWKMKMSKKGHQDRATQSQKKMKADESNVRSQNRVTCGADVVIGRVLPYLINTGDGDSFSYESDIDDGSSDGTIVEPHYHYPLW
jgi:hypothetical protein